MGQIKNHAIYSLLSRSNARTTVFMLFAISKFSIHMDLDKLKKSNSNKYLGLLIDEKLNWPFYAQYLSLQLAKFCSMLYQARNFITEQTFNNVIYNVIIQ